MGVLSDLKLLLTGHYLTVQEVARGYETTEEEARERLNRLVDEEDVFRRVSKDKYAPSERIEDSEDGAEMIKKFNEEFSDLRKELNTSPFES